MPLFFNDRDLDVFRSISTQLIESVMDIQVLYFKLNVQQTQTNVYGEAKRGTGGKKFNKSVSLYALVQHEPQVLDYSQSLKYSRIAIFKFLITTLEQHNIYPQVGDIIGWSRQYWQITKVTQQQLIANSSSKEWSKLCQTTIVSNSKVLKLLKQVQ